MEVTRQIKGGVETLYLELETADEAYFVERFAEPFEQLTARIKKDRRYRHPCIIIRKERT